MGFALWLDRDLAWAQGTHEYRPMGAAVVGATTLFTQRDFHPRLVPPPRTDPRFAGLFASLGDLNSHLRKRRSQPSQINRWKRRRSYLPYF